MTIEVRYYVSPGNDQLLDAGAGCQRFKNGAELLQWIEEKTGLGKVVVIVAVLRL